jgi:hypothetical protein
MTRSTLGATLVMNVFSADPDCEAPVASTRSAARPPSTAASLLTACTAWAKMSWANWSPGCSMVA